MANSALKLIIFFREAGSLKKLLLLSAGSCTQAGVISVHYILASIIVVTGILALDQLNNNITDSGAGCTAVMR